MAAPLAMALLFGGIGLGREKLKSNAARKEQAQQKKALDLFSGGGQLGHRGYGPPTPVGAGETQLTDQQIAVTQAMPDRGAAFTQALQFGQDNVAAAALERAQIEGDENQDIRRDQLKLQRDQFNANQRAATLGEKVTAADLERAQLAVTDQTIGQEEAALSGQDKFRWINPENGNVEVIPLQGTAGFDGQTAAVNADSRLLSLVTRMREINSVVGGTEIDPASPVFAELEALEKDIQLAMKDVLGLGAITGPDVTFIEGLAPDVNSPTTMLLSSPEALEASYRELSKRLENNLGQQLTKVANWENFSDAVRQEGNTQLTLAQQFQPGAREQQQPDPTGQMLRGAANKLGNAPGEGGLPLPPQVQIPLQLLNSIGVSPRALIQQGAQASGTIGGILKGLF